MKPISGAAARLLAWVALVLCGCSQSAAEGGGVDAGADVSGPADAALESSVDASDADAPALIVTAEARPNPTMAVSAFVDVTAPFATDVVVQYGDDTSYGRVTPSLGLDAAGKTTALLLGLLPGQATHLRVDAHAADGRQATTGDLTFVAPTLPSYVHLPTFQVVTDDGTATGFTLQAALFEGSRSATVTDRRGRVMWYRLINGAFDGRGPIGVFDRLPNGHFILAQPWPGFFEELDLSGTVLRAWSYAQDASDHGLDVHEFLQLENGHMAVLGWEGHACDTTPFFADGAADALRTDSTLIDLSPDGATRVVWSSYADLSPADITLDPAVGVDPLAVEVAHANAITLAPDGNLLVSCRQVSQILKIDRDTGQVVWRLGGVRGDFTFVDDPQGGFSMQHDPRFLSNGRLRVHDNGNLHVPQETRVVDYELDETARVARLVAEYRHVPPLYSWAAGSSREVPGGRTLVNFGARGTFTEFDDQGAVHWELSLGTGHAYRTAYLATLHP